MSPILNPPQRKELPRAPKLRLDLLIVDLEDLQFGSVLKCRSFSFGEGDGG